MEYHDHFSACSLPTVPPLHSHVPLAGCLPGLQLCRHPHPHSEAPSSEAIVASAPQPSLPPLLVSLLPQEPEECWLAYWLLGRQDRNFKPLKKS